MTQEPVPTTQQRSAEQEEQDLLARDSKSELKRRALSQEDLGASIVGLTVDQIRKLPLESELLGAILEQRRLTAHGARRRQEQYIGRLMRDADVAALQRAVDALRSAGTRNSPKFRQIEELRERLLVEGDLAIDDVLRERPTADRTELRQLVRAAKKELKDKGTAGNAGRSLFRYLRLLDDTPAAALDDAAAVGDDVA